MKKTLIYIAATLLLIISAANQILIANSNDATSNLPDLGSSAGNILTPRLANQVGNAFVRQARAQMDFIDDPLLLDYINTLGENLAKVATIGTQFEDQAFTFHLINDTSINAFAVPGGQIFIHTGLIANSRSEAQLAATLAHEIAHITENHSARGIENSQYDSAIAMAAILLAIASRDAETAQMAIAASQGGLIQKRLNFSRAFEREADDKALSILHNAGYDPKALTEFLIILDKRQKLSSTNPPAFLLTHPLTSERIGQTEFKANAYSTQKTGSNKTITDQNEQAFKDFKAIIAVKFQGNAKRIVQSFRLDSNALLFASDYFKYGLALAELNQFQEAKKQLTIALEKSPNNLNYIVALSDLDQANQEIESAISRYEYIKTNQSNNYKKIALYHAYTLITAGQNENAIAVLKQFMMENPDNPDAKILIARAYGELGQLFESFLARANYHYLRGNFDFAIQQINTAMTYAPNDAQKSRLQIIRQEYQQEKQKTENALNNL